MVGPGTDQVGDTHNQKDTEKPTTRHAHIGRLKKMKTTSDTEIRACKPGHMGRASQAGLWARIVGPAREQIGWVGLRPVTEQGLSPKPIHKGPYIFLCYFIF